MAEEAVAPPRFCSHCGQPVVVANARFCKECGAPLAGTPILMRGLSWQPALAAGLSVIPGLGHVYRHRAFAGVAWFIGVILAYQINFSFGFILQLLCAGNAALAGAVSEDAIIARIRHGRRSSRWAPPPA